MLVCVGAALTTAAGLWASACMGIAIGAGFYECVVLAFALIFLCSRVFPFIENTIVESARNINIFVEFDSLDDVSKILGCIKSLDAQIFEVAIERGSREQLHPSVTRSDASGKRSACAIVSLQLPKKFQIDALMELVRACEGMVSAEAL